MSTRDFCFLFFTLGNKRITAVKISLKHKIPLPTVQSVETYTQLYD